MWLPHERENAFEERIVSSRQVVRRIDDWAPHGPSEEPSTYRIDYSGVSEPPGSASAVDLAAEIICEIDGPVTLMLSGGVDSQAAAYAAKASGRNCRYVSFRYNGGMNDYDLECPFYKSIGIDVEVIDFDLIGFHEDEILDWGRRYKTASPHILSHMRIASEINDATVVFSGNIELVDQGGLTYQTIGLERFQAISGRPVLGYLFNSSPALFGSYHRLSQFDAPHQSGDGYHRKVRMYQEAGFPVQPQPKKLHGFEKLKEYYDSRAVPSSIRLRNMKKPSQRPYDLLFRYSLSDYDKFPKTNRIFYK